jgi:hypothetical protein
MMKKGLARVVEDVSNEIASKRNEQRQKIEMEQLDLKARQQFGKPMTISDKVFK